MNSAERIALFLFEASEEQDRNVDSRLSKFKSFLSKINFRDGIPRDVFIDLRVKIGALVKLHELYLPDEVFSKVELQNSSDERDRLFSLLKSIGICCDVYIHEATSSSEYDILSIVSEPRPKRARNTSASDVHDDSESTQTQERIPGFELMMQEFANLRKGISEEIKAQSKRTNKKLSGISKRVDALSSSAQYVSARKTTEFFKHKFSELVENDNLFRRLFSIQNSTLEMPKIWQDFCNKLNQMRSNTVYIQLKKKRTAISFGNLLAQRNPRFNVESKCQCFLNVIFQILCEILPNRTVDWRDTSTSTHAPTNPLFQFDATFVALNSGSSFANCTVAWPDVVWITEAKRDIEKKTSKDKAQMQIVEGVSELVSKQTYFTDAKEKFGREAGVGVITDGVFIYFMEYRPGTLGIARSSRMPLFPDNEFNSNQPVPSGFMYLVHLLVADHGSLHYTTNADSVLARTELVPADAHVRAHRLSQHSKPDIFFVDPNGDSALPFAIKRYKTLPQMQNELLCYKLAESGLTVDQKLHFPELIDFHEGNRLISMRPLAQWTLSDCLFSMELFVEVIQAGLQILPMMHSRNWAHGDISPNNLLVCREGPSGACRVVINDFSHTCELGTSVENFFGTMMYSSIQMDILLKSKYSSFCYGPIHDWQSFAIMLLEFCIPRASLRFDRRLLWDQATPLSVHGLCDVKRLFLTNESEISQCVDGTLLDDAGKRMLKELLRCLFGTGFAEANESCVARALGFLKAYLDTGMSTFVCFFFSLENFDFHVFIFDFCRAPIGFCVRFASSQDVSLSLHLRGSRNQRSSSFSGPGREIEISAVRHMFSSELVET
jgi:hypothetical protein